MKLGRLRVCRIAGVDNPVDHFTKPLGRDQMSKQLQMLGGRIVVNGGGDGADD